MNVFEITIQHSQGASWPVVAEHRRSGQLPQRSEGELTLKQKFVEDLLQLRLHVHGYGSYLGEVLFQGTILIKFMQARAQAETDEEPLRILLVVEAPDLKPLRWERLCAPDSSGDWNFLALDQRNPFSLYLPSLTDRRFSAIGRRDLRALVLLADPPKDNRYKLDSFDAQATADSIGKALGDIPFDLLGPVKKAVGPASIDALCAQITAEQYTFFHLVAHGLYRNDGETTIYLLDEAHQVAPLSASDLIKRLKNLGGVRGLPHLAFLCTCESAKPEAEAALGGLAQQLVRDLGLPAVVAMTDPVSITTAEILSTSFYRQLRKHGQPDQALTEACAGMQGRADILVPALYSRLGGKPLFSDELNGRTLTDPEIEYGLERLACQLPARAPVQLHPFLAHAHTLWNTLGTKRKELSSVASKEHDNALSACNNLCDVVLERSFSAMALGQPIPEYKSICPFPGLKAFQTEEQEFFFGRDMKTEELTARLQDERFLAVLGASGSGKSSLVLAGMIPALKKQAEQKGSSLQVRYLTPGSEPEKTLARQLEIPSSDEQPVLPSLPSLPSLPILPSLLVVDQFEELFTLCADPVARKHFLDRLLAAWNKQPDLHVILTMRADFWGDCAPYLELKKLMQAHQELLAPMTAAELRTAMEEQASSVGLRFEGGLSHTILSQVEGEPGAMPLLQHLLLELWKRRHGRWLMASEYEELGGIKEAIGRTAEVIYDQFKGDKKGQGLLRTLFVRLTRLDEGSTKQDKIAANTTPRSDSLDKDPYSRDTRQRVNLKELLSLDTDKERVRNLVKLLADARLLVTTTDKDSAGKDVTEVEVAHEALIRHWPRLRNWLNEDRESWMLLASVGQQAKDWEKGGKKAGGLPRWGDRLRDAKLLFGKEHFAQSKLEQEFLQACKELSDKEKAKEAAYLSGLKKRLAMAVIGIVVAVASAFFAFNKMQESIEHERIAEEQLVEANHNLGLIFSERAETAEQNSYNFLANAYSLYALEKLSQKKKSEAYLGAIIQAQGRPVLLPVLIRYYTNKLRGMAFSSDARTVASGHSDNTVEIWDVVTGKNLQIFDGSVSKLIFSPDGQTLASRYKLYHINILNIKNGKSIKFKKKHTKNIESLSFSPDGLILASADLNNIIFWNVTSGTPIHSIKLKNDIFAITFSPDGQHLASATVRGVEIWNVHTGQRHQRLSEYSSILSVAFSPDGHTLAAGSFGKIELWELGYDSSLIKKTFKEDTGSGVLSIAFSPDGQKIAASFWNHTIGIWEVKTEQLLCMLEGHTGPARSVLFSSDGQTLISRSADNTIRVWEASTSRVRYLKGHNSFVSDLSFLPDKQTVISGAQDHSIRTWDVTSGQELQRKYLQQKNGRISTMSFSPDKSISAVVYWDNSTINLVNAVTGDSFRYLTLDEGHTERVLNVCFSPNGHLLASSSLDNSMAIWDVKTGELLKKNSGVGFLRSLVFSKDSRILATGGNNIDFWDGTTGSHLLKLKNQAISLSFSSDNRVIASGSRLGLIKIWEVSTGKHMLTLRGHTRDISSLSFSPDDKLLASISKDNTVGIWDTKTGNRLQTIKVQSNVLSLVRFSPDGKALVFTTNDNLIGLWELQPFINDWSGISLDENGEYQLKLDKLPYKLEGIDLVPVKQKEHAPNQPARWSRHHPFHWLPNAEKGDSNAMLQIGIIYDRNNDIARALRWYGKAIKAGNEQAKRQQDILLNWLQDGENRKQVPGPFMQSLCAAQAEFNLPKKSLIFCDLNSEKPAEQVGD